MTVKTKEIQLLISGRVQGVGFRAATERKGRELNLNGWVRNLTTGEVETYAKGPEDVVNEFVSWCNHGPAGARVDSVTEVQIDRRTKLGADGFHILFNMRR